MSPIIKFQFPIIKFVKFAFSMIMHGRSQDFSKGGHTDSYRGYSSDCHLNIVSCLLTRRLTKGGGVTGTPGPPWLRLCHGTFPSPSRMKQNVNNVAGKKFPVDPCSFPWIIQGNRDGTVVKRSSPSSLALVPFWPGGLRLFSSCFAPRVFLGFSGCPLRKSQHL